MTRESPADALLVAEFGGETALLGAFQRPGRSGLREVRGLCGGRSAWAGDGVCALFAAIADVRSWLPDERGALGGPRLLNRLVRGVLAALTPFGVAPSYPGRDFVSVDGKRVAQLALSRSASGAILFQALVAGRRPFTTAEPAPEFPGLPALPPPGVLGIEGERLCAALVDGFAARFGLELVPAQLGREDEAGTGEPPLAAPGLEGLSAGDPVATPIGELVAYAALRADGALERVRLCGDWMAAPFAVGELEESLRGLAPAAAELRERCARWLAEPEHLVVGVTDPGALVEAIARAASQSSSVSPSTQ